MPTPAPQGSPPGPIGPNVVTVTGSPGPVGRTITYRNAVRVLLLDLSDRVLLFLDSDPGLTGSTWWMTPGGGIDPGETESQAAVRELREETGLKIAESDLIGPIATRTVHHGYSDKITHQHEVFYVVRTERFRLDLSGHTVDEQLTVLDHRWWTLDELAGTSETVWPGGIVKLLELDPTDWPRDLGDVEESTLPI